MELKMRNGDYVSDGIGGEKRAIGTEELLARAGAAPGVIKCEILAG